MRLLSGFLLFVILTVTSSAEETVTPFSSVKGNISAQKFRKSYKIIYDKFKQAIISARAAAAKQGDIEEIKNIQSALDGKFEDEFKTTAAKSALKTFKYNVNKLCKTYVTDLKLNMKEELQNGNVEAAEEIQSVLKQIEKATLTSKNVTKTCKVEAVKDWQSFDLPLKKGDKVTFYAQGTWTPNRKLPKKDANTYPLTVKIGNTAPFNIGKNKTITSSVSADQLSFRMFARRNRIYRKNASGVLSVKVVCESADSLLECIHNLAAEQTVQSIKQNASVEVEEKENPYIGKKERKKRETAEKKESSQEGFIPQPPDDITPEKKSSVLKHTKTGNVYIVEIVANKSWQNTGITLPPHTSVLISSNGKWSLGREKKGKTIWKSVDELKLAGMIGNKSISCGGSKWLITKPRNPGGLLKLRMNKYEKYKEKYNPKGKIRVKIKLLK